MVIQTGAHPAELRDRVTTPGGTTIAGLASLERDGFRSAAIEAVTVAAIRSTELGK
jgi:pyrroline-5-carboxylate reductase